jgi:uncharacterized protein (DUF2236 family)
MPETPQPVAPQHLEKMLAGLHGLPGDPNAGFFGPESVSWQINRECAVFLGAGRAALLQWAHPWVATALAQHSNLMHDAIGRFHSTFRVIYTMLFGTRGQALAASRGLYGLHTTIRGELTADVGGHRAHTPYQANEVTALRWVYATLVESAVLAYEFVLPPLSAEQRETYYRESFRMAALCGIPAEALPGSWEALRAYVAALLASPTLAVDEGASRMGQAVLSGVGTWVRPPRWYCALTASWLPEHLREAFVLPFGAAEQRSLARAAKWLPRVYPRLPRMLRFVGPYHEAQARLQRQTPGGLTQASNRFWMGRSRLLYPEG